MNARVTMLTWNGTVRCRVHDGGIVLDRVYDDCVQLVMNNKA
jgi:hypothetical protein